MLHLGERLWWALKHQPDMARVCLPLDVGLVCILIISWSPSDLFYSLHELNGGEEAKRMAARFDAGNAGLGCGFYLNIARHIAVLVACVQGYLAARCLRIKEEALQKCRFLTQYCCNRSG